MSHSETQKMGNVMSKPETASAAEPIAGVRPKQAVPARGRR
jgi:hypothetical protein